MQTVELRPAYVWTCEECAADNFVAGLVPSIDPDAERQLREDHNIEPDMEGIWVYVPEEVECRKCKARFKAEHYDHDRLGGGSADV